MSELATSNGKPRAIIDDGYTRDGLIPELRRGGQVLHDALRFKYRPLLHGERVRMQSEIKDADVVEGERITARYLAGCLCWWDLRDSLGNAVNVDAGQVERLEPHLFGDLFGYVYGDHSVEYTPLDAWRAKRDGAIENAAAAIAADFGLAESLEHLQKLIREALTAAPDDTESLEHRYGDAASAKN